MESTGFGTRISHWFARYLTKLEIKKKGKNFHSFRHTVVNRLTNKKVYQGANRSFSRFNYDGCLWREKIYGCLVEWLCADKIRKEELRHYNVFLVIEKKTGYW